MVDTLIQIYQRARTSNATDASFPSKVATLTEPTGAGVIKPHRMGSMGSGVVLVTPYGAGADNTTFDMRVISWRQTTLLLWVPTIICQVSCTLSAAVGVAATDVLDTDRFADTITLGIGNAGIDCQVFSPANDTAGHVILDAKGASLVEITFDMTGATSGNALYAWV